MFQKQNLRIPSTDIGINLFPAFAIFCQPNDVLQGVASDGLDLVHSTHRRSSAAPLLLNRSSDRHLLRARSITPRNPTEKPCYPLIALPVLFLL